MLLLLEFLPLPRSVSLLRVDDWNASQYFLLHVLLLPHHFELSAIFSIVGGRIGDGKL
ncbi:hypothetical protein JG688_00012381 [Phytophthora aleatoria]|uniref:Uncharacterized protein n=1 Tax=Phytophthora aleatoria TaxID=2496075 RepID=A0A8J5LZY9_9STRA|nr:hypothetical protein JG688_00012381 [Phytophthora aleatoria]